MQQIAAIFPLKWMTQGMRSVFLPEASTPRRRRVAGSTAGSRWSWRPGACRPVSCAVRTFRWTQAETRTAELSTDAGAASGPMRPAVWHRVYAVLVVLVAVLATWSSTGHRAPARRAGAAPAAGAAQLRPARRARRLVPGLRPAAAGPDGASRRSTGRGASACSLRLPRSASLLLLFVALRPDLWPLLGRLSDAVAVAVGADACSRIAVVGAAGWTCRCWSTVLPMAVLALVVVVLFGIWIGRIIGQSERRADAHRRAGGAPGPSWPTVSHQAGVLAERERLARRDPRHAGPGLHQHAHAGPGRRADVDARPGRGPPAAGRGPRDRPGEPGRGAGPGRRAHPGGPAGGSRCRGGRPAGATASARRPGCRRRGRGRPASRGRCAGEPRWCCCARPRRRWPTCGKHAGADARSRQSRYGAAGDQLDGRRRRRRASTPAGAPARRLRAARACAPAASRSVGRCGGQPAGRGTAVGRCRTAAGWRMP